MTLPPVYLAAKTAYNAVLSLDKDFWGLSLILTFDGFLRIAVVSPVYVTEKQLCFAVLAICQTIL